MVPSEFFHLTLTSCSLRHDCWYTLYVHTHTSHKCLYCVVREKYWDVAERVPCSQFVNGRKARQIFCIKGLVSFRNSRSIGKGKDEEEKEEREKEREGRFSSRSLSVRFIRSLLKRIAILRNRISRDWAPSFLLWDKKRLDLWYWISFSKRDIEFVLNIRSFLQNEKSRWKNSFQKFKEKLNMFLFFFFILLR